MRRHYLECAALFVIKQLSHAWRRFGMHRRYEDLSLSRSNSLDMKAPPRMRKTKMLNTAAHSKQSARNPNKPKT